MANLKEWVATRQQIIRDAQGRDFADYGPDIRFMNDAREALPQAVAALAALRKKHWPTRIYEECDCTPEQIDVNPSVHVEAESIGFTCAWMYNICEACCTEPYGGQTEDCADGHNHAPNEPYCPDTIGVIEQALEGVGDE